jgi:cation diffusion facilitator family transporter
VARRASSGVVVAAVLANVAVALVKLLAAIATGSAAMLAETIHSVVDTGDGLLVLLGKRLGRRAASALHPFGHGKEVYFWTLMVAMIVFGAGGGVAMYQGVERLLRPAALEHVSWSYAVLAVAAAFEGTSFVISVKSFLDYRRARLPGYSVWRAIRAAKDPTVFVVMLEDGAALVGLLVAFLGILLSTQLGRPRLDATASLLIGVLLVSVAFVLGRECRGLLIGERALPEVIAGIRSLVEEQRAVDHVVAVQTMHLGPDRLLVALHLAFRADVADEDRTTLVAKLGEQVRERFPDVQHVWIDAASFQHARH